MSIASWIIPSFLRRANIWRGRNTFSAPTFVVGDLNSNSFVFTVDDPDFGSTRQAVIGFESPMGESSFGFGFDTNDLAFFNVSVPLGNIISTQNGGSATIGSAGVRAKLGSTPSEDNDIVDVQWVSGNFVSSDWVALNVSFPPVVPPPILSNTNYVVSGFQQNQLGRVVIPQITTASRQIKLLIALGTGQGSLSLLTDNAVDRFQSSNGLNTTLNFNIDEVGFSVLTLVPVINEGGLNTWVVGGTR